MKKITPEKQIKIGKITITNGLCRVLKAAIRIGRDPLFDTHAQAPGITENLLYKMIDRGSWEITEFPDAVRLEQTGIEIEIRYSWNGIDQDQGHARIQAPTDQELEEASQARYATDQARIEITDVKEYTK